MVGRALRARRGGQRSARPTGNVPIFYVMPSAILPILGRWDFFFVASALSRSKIQFIGFQWVTTVWMLLP
jgi:hypothetical protein